MKSSAWYHKLWHRKLQELPLKEDAGSAWTDMKKILDQQLPIANPSGNISAKSLGAKVVAFFSYVIPVAAMIGGAAYFAILHVPTKTSVTTRHKNDHKLFHTDTNFVKERMSHPVVKDSILDENNLKVMPSPNAKISNRSNYSDSLVNSLAYKDTLLKRVVNVVNDTVGKADTPIKTLLANDIKKPEMGNQQDMKKESWEVRREKSGKPVKIKLPKSAKVRQRKEIIIPKYNYGLDAGLNVPGRKVTAYFGAFGVYRLNSHWLASIGLRLNTQRSFSGDYSHASYFRPDSMPSFKFTDVRKLFVIDVPIIIEYKVLNSIGLKAGPIISMPLSQSGITVGAIAKPSDTLMNGKKVIGILNDTKVNKINIGVSVGISFHIHQFDLNTRYEWLSPYSFNNELGTYRRTYQGFQFGIGYRFN